MPPPAALKRDWLTSLAADIAAPAQGQARHPGGVLRRHRARPRRAETAGAARCSSRKRRPPPRSGRSRWRAPGRRALGAHGITAGQVLLTLGDTEERRRYLNARETIDKLLEWRSVPVINENDTVATSEIRYGDNDRLAARVATMTSADLLVLLSDVDGLYDKPPAQGGRQARACGRAHHAGDRGDGRRLRIGDCRAAACSPRSRPARSPPPPARTW